MNIRVCSWKTYILRQENFLNCQKLQSRVMGTVLTTMVGQQWNRKGK